MKHFYLKLLFVITFFSSCSSYSRLAKHNRVGIEDSYMVYSNEKLNLRSATFGDFSFASSSEEFRRLTTNQKPAFKNVLLYAKTSIPPVYEYYLILNTGSTHNPNFIFRTTNVGANRITLAIDKNAPKEDIELIAAKIAELKSTPASNTRILP